MSFELVLDFSSNGQVEAMHMDKFDLGFLGKQSITRATEILFNETTQLWGLSLPDGVGWKPVAQAQGFATYEMAREFEVAWLNICREQDLQPGLDEGENVMRILRLYAPSNNGKPLTILEYRDLS